MRRRTGWMAVACALLVPTMALGAGFSIWEAGGKALGMGGAFTAQADDPSAIFFNTAGIADLDGTSAYFGTSLIFTGTKFSGVDPYPGFGVQEETGTMVFPPSNAYLTRRVHDRVVVGLGFYNAFGLGQEWDNPSRFTGRHVSHDVFLGTFWFNPAVAVRLNDYVSIGAGPTLVYSTVNLKRYLQQWDPNGSGYLDVGRVELDGNSSVDFGFNGGILVTPDDDWRIGVAFHSQLDAEITGTADFTQLASGNPALDAVVAAQFPKDQGVATTVKLPWIVSTGIAYDGIDRVRLTADLNVFGWSRFDSLAFDFDDASLRTVRPQNYENSIQIRTGFSYAVDDDLDLRLGYYWDETPQPVSAMSPLLGDASRHAVSAGIGVRRGDWTIDAFGLVLITSERSTEGKSNDDFNGTYRAYGSILGLNLGLAF